MIDIINDEITAPSNSKVSKGKPHVVILLDESGSMSPYRESVVSTFNEYVESVKDSAHDISLYTFESKGGWGEYAKTIIKRKLDKVNPSRVPKLKDKDYCPGGGTPLYDSMATLMQKFEKSKRPVQFVTHTDGQENSSTEWNFRNLDDYTKKLEKKGWMFVHLGEGVEGRKEFGKFSAGLKLNFSNATRSATMESLGATTKVYSCSGINAASAYGAKADGSIDIDAGEQLDVSDVLQKNKTFSQKDSS